MEDLAKKANEIYKLLNKNSPSEIIFLEFRNPFETLISVILSAQTTDKQVNSIQGELFSSYPTAEKLAKADLAKVEQIIKPVGFFKTKAKNIILTAQKLVSDFNGQVPSTIEELITLNGCGRKSANVVVGHCFNAPAIIVDTHFGRVMLRLGLTKSKDPTVVEKEIKKIVEPKKQFRFSMSANLHGRLLCHARKPDCQNCYLQKLCDFYNSNLE